MDAHTTDEVRRQGRIGPVVRRVAFFSGVWWLLVGGSPSGWLFGLVAIPGATAASIRLGPSTPLRLRPGPFVAYLASFLVESLRSGWDVARRAFHPRLPLAPEFVDYPLRLADPTSRVLLAATITMLPGTISAEIHADRLVIHAIDATRPIAKNVRAMETRIGALFGIRLPANALQTGPAES
ncbi:MAG: Na+/H+ antiporter subunit E [Gemmatimonadota bacterium]|nr:Na+/H+ antiporter subunit E [Gemmatimonadota bacterium]